MAKVVLQESANRKENMHFFIRRNSMCFIVLSTSAMLGIYFVLSIGLTFYQKWFLQVSKLNNIPIACLVRPGSNSSIVFVIQD